MRVTWINKGFLCGIVLVVLLVADCGLSISWLGLSRSGQRFWNKTKHCRTVRQLGFTKYQRKICKLNLELMSFVAHASREAVQVCQDLFHDRRWNCSTVSTAPNYMADLSGGSREQAYVYSLSAAALSQVIAKACSLGVTTKCGCSRLPSEPPPDNFKWGGCGDNLEFGELFSKTFTDQEWIKRRKGKYSKKSLTNQHNNEAGRQMVAESLTTACKCHGVSGSCSIKTCWKSLKDIKTVGLALQRQYSLAVEVTKRRVRGQHKLVPVHPSRPPFTKTELIYYRKSPDYCMRDISSGSLGTSGRECDKEHRGSKGCRSMCCGRGYTSEVVKVKHRCDCKYYWCCYVKCKTCIKEVQMNKCQ